MKGLADKVYFLPVTLEYVEQVIAHERPDGVALSFGGQTALNCGIQLDKAGVFEKYNVRVIGTPVKAIIETEDREAFTRKLHTINEHTCPNIACTTVEQVLAVSRGIGLREREVGVDSAGLIRRSAPHPQSTNLQPQRRPKRSATRL